MRNGFQCTAQTRSELGHRGPAGDRGFPQLINPTSGKPRYSVRRAQGSACGVGAEPDPELGLQGWVWSRQPPSHPGSHLHNGRDALQLRKNKQNCLIPGFQMNVFTWSLYFTHPLTSGRYTGELYDACLESSLSG